ncbi:hypothetical protein F441_22341 [Phytophthora nicotianae CJ01A1]|uniref:Uncharacterized protein n=1 Tax=Phytophthora nicotianae CJ01A1 TaxID=1317063 RepID=W2VSB1_PHYNI|nr:hypothetical protein F441_22341 [Phytophthora nicotianae CJ01A1]
MADRIKHWILIDCERYYTDRDRRHDDPRQTITDRADGIYVRYLEAFATAKTQGSTWLLISI